MSEQLISTIDGKSLYAKSAASAGTASVAVSDVNGAPITGTYATQAGMTAYQPTANMTAYQPTITYGYSGDAITAIDGSAIGGQDAIQYFTSEDDAKNGPQGVLCIVTGG